MQCSLNLRAWLECFLRRYRRWTHFWTPKFECKFVALLVTKIKYLCCGNSSSFFLLCSVTRDLGGAEIVTQELFFGNRFLDYVDSLFFFLPFSSKSQAEAARANTSTTHEDWSALREHLQQDHRKPESRDILIKAWKNYVATSFEQPAAAAAGSSSVVGPDGGIFDLADDDDVEAPNALPPDDT